MRPGSEAARTVYQTTAERGFSGGEAQVFLLLEGLRARGWRSVVVAPARSAALGEADRRGFETRAWRVRNDLDLPAALRLRALLRREAPPLVHFHSMRAHVVGAWSAKRGGARVVATRRMDYAIARHPVNALAYLRSTDRVIAISAAVERALLEFGVPPERVRRVPSGVDAARFDPDRDPAGARARAGLPPDGPLVLCVASLHPRKEHATLLRAFARTAADRPDAWLLLAGEGPERRALEDLARSLGLEARARFLGSRADVPDLLAACDLFVLPSRFEGLGVAALEAMAAARAVVGSRAGGLAEVVVEGETGLLVPPADPAALAAALARLLGDRPLRERMGRLGRARVEAAFSAEAMVAGTERVYGELLGN